MLVDLCLSLVVSCTLFYLTSQWCMDDCYSDPAAQRVMDRIANITGIPEGNHEHLQLLRYEVGQFYQSHNDYIDYQVRFDMDAVSLAADSNPSHFPLSSTSKVNRPPGVRILTFYLYLNDVEEGGETNFPRLGLSVKPKQGRAVLWPSILHDDPNGNDIRSDHQAKPVLKGIKYGANAWLHQRDVKGELGSQCL